MDSNLELRKVIDQNSFHLHVLGTGMAAESIYKQHLCFNVEISMRKD